MQALPPYKKVRDKIAVQKPTRIMFTGSKSLHKYIGLIAWSTFC
ncbi:hypothetical protein [Desulfosarcina cetonica]|nr:hypothetical protein [Desulfosarcina cetonica]